MNIYDKAVQLLKIRPHFRSELAKKLQLRGFAKSEIDDVINRLSAEGVLNDEQFIQIYLDNLIKYKTFGFYGLKVKLMLRGIASNDAETVLKQKLSLETEKEIAMRLLEKSKNLDKIKLAQKLSRKGFRSEVIRELINY